MGSRGRACPVHDHLPPGREHLCIVAEPRLFETPFRSPLLPPWELTDAERLKALQQTPPRQRHKAADIPVVPERLFS